MDFKTELNKRITNAETEFKTALENFKVKSPLVLETRIRLETLQTIARLYDSMYRKEKPCGCIVDYNEEIIDNEDCDYKFEPHNLGDVWEDNEGK